eukprot:CAMPEP_0182451486 /NCGR_PEP_ID=MMETSP1172-20130603/43747_1 /TAXON_ID=708627 /ORGANISM="Timspurckia oligopyrenoides, Strain CCMP3278" /LENGTH=232 /DNA_ID=CAMNT_0024649267 /DNA_START=143 /DNA_END=842 /DNA_ORIENTATION=+
MAAAFDNDFGLLDFEVSDSIGVDSLDDDFVGFSDEVCLGFEVPLVDFPVDTGDLSSHSLSFGGYESGRSANSVCFVDNKCKERAMFTEQSPKTEVKPLVKEESRALKPSGGIQKPYSTFGSGSFSGRMELEPVEELALKPSGGIQKPYSTFGSGSFSGRMEVELVEETWTREDALRRYKEKRQRRCFKKVVRYDCRKKIAASRPRVGGRFARKSEMDRIDSVISLVSMAAEE